MSEHTVGKIEFVPKIDGNFNRLIGARVSSVGSPTGSLVIPSRKWDLRYLSLAQLVSTWSKDPSTQTGAVIVRSDKSVLSVGFNGFPARMKDDKELYNNREQKYSRVVHCEVNALLFAHEQLTGCTLYTHPFASCDRCCVQMIQAGITRFVFPALAADKRERWEKSMNLTKSYIEEARLEWCEVA